MAGWGIGAWGYGTWGNGETLPIGDSATGSVGALSPNISIELTGVLCHPDVGGVSEENTPEIQEVHANGYAGNAEANLVIALSGVSADGSVGTVTHGGVEVNLTGDIAYGYPGGVIVPLNSNYATGAVGTVSPELVIALSGVTARGNVSRVFVGPRPIHISGNLATGNEGDLVAVYWKNIDDTQMANWQNISNPQTPDWSEINDAQTANWEEVVT